MHHVRVERGRQGQQRARAARDALELELARSVRARRTVGDVAAHAL
jgi:hypothetical protein